MTRTDTETTDELSAEVATLRYEVAVAKGRAERSDHLLTAIRAAVQARAAGDDDGLDGALAIAANDAHIDAASDADEAESAEAYLGAAEAAAIEAEPEECPLCGRRDCPDADGTGWHVDSRVACETCDGMGEIGPTGRHGDGTSEWRACASCQGTGRA